MATKQMRDLIPPTTIPCRECGGPMGHDSAVVDGVVCLVLRCWKCDPDPESLRVLDVDEMGFFVKGHGLTAEAMREALRLVAEAHGYDEGVSPADCHPRSEVWVRQRPALPGDLSGYAYYVDLTAPHARGAGRFTFIDVTRGVSAENDSTKEGQE